MLRRFRAHDVRPMVDLRGVWDFAFLGNVEPDEVEPAAIAFTDCMAVPGCFDATPAYAGKRGLAAYRTRVLLPTAGRRRLILDGIHDWCRIFANGRAIADHSSGFTRFSVDVVLAEGPTEIVVLADNRFDYQRCPLHLDYFDWYNYGGIARGVELHRLGDVWLDALEVATQDYAARKLSVTIRYGATSQAQAPLSITFDGAEALSERVGLNQGTGEITRTLQFPGAPLWTPDEPNLHLLYVRLGDDDMRERIGLRQVWTEGRKLMLNGKPIRLQGVNRHESHPQFGHGLPDALLVADAQIIRDLGCNFVRGSHYPQDARWLDLCDEMGFLVWSEVLGWQHTAEHLNDPHFMQVQLLNLEEMVAAARNHASVIMYGILNESHSHDPACRTGYQTLLGRLRQLDPTRLLTYATCFPEGDLCLDLVDVVAVNTYPGWYHHTPVEIPSVLDDLARMIDAKGFADKPLMIGEIGAAALWGWRDWHAGRYSEQYQADVLDRALKHLLDESGRWCGVAVWQFCDVRSTESLALALGRPRGFNNKGLVDEYRRPKMAYDVVKRHYRAARGKT